MIFVCDIRNVQEILAKFSRISQEFLVILKIDFSLAKTNKNFLRNSREISKKFRFSKTKITHEKFLRIS